MNGCTAPMAEERPLCVLIAALGGQGGGVLADWLVAAAHQEGFPAQATSIPGVAQRTGATTYYFELFPRRDPPKPPVFSLYPSSGDVDLIAALEPTEAGRALALGYVGRETTVISARERTLSTAEKMPAGDGTIAARPVLAALARAGKRLIEIDAPTNPGAETGPRVPGRLNAVLFGAIAETGVLPLSPSACRAAIEHAGVAVATNLAGFEAGVAVARRPSTAPEAAPDPLSYSEAPEGFAREVADLPDPLRAIVGHGLARLVDYQDAGYARLYLDRLRPIIALDHDSDCRLSRAVARKLAAWMAFEDVIRVAQLKTRPGRLARIRAEVGGAEDAPLTVIDFLKPGREELDGVLPPVLARLLPPPKAGKAGTGVGMRINTASPTGFLAFRMLAVLRPWRRRTVRYVREQAAIEIWLGAVVGAARRDPALASDVVGAAVWARGYGEVRNHGLRRLDALFNDWERRLDDDPEAVRAAVRNAIDDAHNNPDGEEMS